MQIFEYFILFSFIVLVSGGWGALGCKWTGLPACFLFMLGFAVWSLLAYLVFFVFLLDATLGRVAACLLGLGSLGVTAFQFRKPEVRKDFFQADVWLPLLLLFLYTTGCFLVLLFHGGDPSRVFTSQMPTDNILPQVLADRFWNGGSVTPFMDDWLSSDRPPLQAAVSLMCRPFEFLKFDANDIYGIVSTLCQAIWLPAVYLLARQLSFSRYAMGFTLTWFAGSGFFLLHSIYTWPKLLSASLFLSGLAVLFFCAKNRMEKYPQALLSLGLFWSLSLLSHGGIIFSFLAVPFLPSAWRVAAANKLAIAGAVLVLILINLPWMAYQKFYDPPANRLIKMHLAGVIDVDKRGTMETLREAYSSLTFGQWVQNRLANVETSVVWDDPRPFRAFESAASMQFYLDMQCFFRTSAVLGLLLIGYIILLAERLGWKRPGPSADSRWGELLLMSAGCYLIWILLMFQPNGAIVHQGSYAMIIVLLMIGTLGVTELPVWAGCLLLACQWGLFTFIFLYSFYMPLIANTAWYTFQVLYWIIMGLFVGSLHVFLPRSAKD